MDMITLVSMLRIPVCMHNVSGEMLFRPSACGAFGMDTEGAYFRACSVSGHYMDEKLYGNVAFTTPKAEIIHHEKQGLHMPGMS